MKTLKNIAVKSTIHSKPIVTDVFYKPTNKKKQLVIFCHGYKGFKDWGCWDKVAKNFVDENIFFIKFNFSHNGGTLKNPIDFPDLKAFGENNFTIELQDLEDVINWISNNSEFENEVDVNDITLIGHSRGGGIVLIKALENKQVSKVITWNGVSDFGSRFPKDEQLEQWQKEGIIHILNGRTLQQMPHTYQFYQNFKENEERLTIKNVVKKLTKPQLIITGSNDTVVTPKEGEIMHSWNPKSTLIEIDEMNHVLGGKHPWENENLPKHLKKAVSESIKFIKK